MTSDTVINPEKMRVAATAASNLLKTLSHKDRLMVLCLLQEGEKSVGQIAQNLELPQSPLSQHLARMRREGLVQTRRSAQTIFYSIQDQKTVKLISTMYELFCPD